MPSPSSGCSSCGQMTRSWDSFVCFIRVQPRPCGLLTGPILKDKRHKWLEGCRAIQVHHTWYQTISKHVQDPGESCIANSFPTERGAAVCSSEFSCRDKNYRSHKQLFVGTCSDRADEDYPDEEMCVVLAGLSPLRVQKLKNFCHTSVNSSAKFPSHGKLSTKWVTATRQGCGPPRTSTLCQEVAFRDDLEQNNFLPFHPSLATSRRRGKKPHRATQSAGVLPVRFFWWSRGRPCRCHWQLKNQ